MSILLAGWNDAFLMETARRLVDEGAPVSHITLIPGYKGLPGELGGYFREKGVTLLDELDYWIPERILALDKEAREALPGGLVREMAHCENVYLASTDRLSFVPVSVARRRRLYFLLLQHWSRFLRERGIRSVIFSSTPHMGWDLVLYHLGKHMGLKVLFFNRTLIRDRLLFHEDIDASDKVPTDYLAGADRETIIGRIGESLLSESLAESPWAKRSKDINAGMRRGVSLDKRRVLWLFKHRREEFLNSAFYYNEKVNTNGRLFPHYLRLYMEQRALHRFYHSLVSTPDYSRKYVFFAMHFQPERSTLPEGGVFEDQILALDILSQSIPEDWLIYVKEHPRQFSLRFQSRHGRSRDFYRQIKGMRNVRLIDTREDAARLARDSALVATITGSVGWEGIQMGRACIAFGRPWYYACNSCHLVDSVESCRDAIAGILSKSREEVELDLLKYLAFYKDRFVLASNQHDMALQSERSYGLLAGNLADRILRETAVAAAPVRAAASASRIGNPTAFTAISLHPAGLSSRNESPV